MDQIRWVTYYESNVMYRTLRMRSYGTNIMDQASISGLLAPSWASWRILVTPIPSHPHPNPHPIPIPVPIIPHPTSHIPHPTFTPIPHPTCHLRAKSVVARWGAARRAYNMSIKYYTLAAKDPKQQVKVCMFVLYLCAKPPLVNNMLLNCIAIVATKIVGAKTIQA